MKSLVRPPRVASADLSRSPWRPNANEPQLVERDPNEHACTQRGRGRENEVQIETILLVYKSHAVVGSLFPCVKTRVRPMFGGCTYNQVQPTCTCELAERSV